MSELLQWVQQKDEKYFFIIFDNKSTRSFWKIFLEYVSKTGDGYLLFLTTLFGFFISDNSYQFITVALFAIGMTIGVSQNNIILGIGLGVAFGAALGHLQMKKENSSSEIQ